MTAQLTERQKQVHTLVHRGLGNRQIARLLGISKAAVQDHRNAIERKLGPLSQEDRGYPDDDPPGGC